MTLSEISLSGRTNKYIGCTVPVTIFFGRAISGKYPEKCFKIQSDFSEIDILGTPKFHAFRIFLEISCSELGFNDSEIDIG